MMLNEDIYLPDGLPVAYIKSINTLVVSDLHLGYEGMMAKRGMLIPKVNLRSIEDIITKSAEETGAKSIIVNGDIKNEFSNVETEEFNEMLDLIRMAERLGLRMTLIKGNHDNFVDRYREAFHLEIHSQSANIGEYMFIHGERRPVIRGRPRMMIMGHEHPAISITNEAGVRERLRCFLFGSYKGIPLLVLPAMNYFAGSTDINMADRDELLSPVLGEVNVDAMHAIAIGYGSTIDFGTISDLRRAGPRAMAGL